MQCTQHIGENYILEEVVAMPSAPSHTPESLLSHERRYAWPGNIRELQNVIERAVIQPCDEIDHESCHTAVPSVLNLTDIFQLIIDRLDERALPQEQFVHSCGFW